MALFVEEFLGSAVAGGGGFFELLHFAEGELGFEFERCRGGDIEPDFVCFVELLGVEAQALKYASGHHFIARESHVHAVTGEGVFAGSVGFADFRLHEGIEVGEAAVFFFGEGAEKLIVRNEFLIVRVRLIFADHGGGENNDLDAGCLSLVHDGGDVFLVVIDEHAVLTVPDIVDATTEGHPLGFFAKHIFLQTGQHLVGFVAADAGADDFYCHAIGGEALADEVDVAAGAALSSLGDGVAEESDFITRFDGDLGEGGGDGEGEEDDGFHGKFDF